MQVTRSRRRLSRRRRSPRSFTDESRHRPAQPRRSLRSDTRPRQRHRRRGGRHREADDRRACPPTPTSTCAPAALSAFSRRSGPRSSKTSRSVKAIALPVSLAVLVDRVRRTHGRVPAHRRRHHIDRHDAAGARAHDESHRGLDSRAHRRNRIRSRVVHRLRPTDGVAIPRRTRQRKRTTMRRSSRRSPPRVAR